MLFKSVIRSTPERTDFLANRMICSRGRQFGVLQNVLFRFDRNMKGRKEIFRQIKVPSTVYSTRIPVGNQIALN